jgi:transcriptional regulator with XRE-family HTH domain
VSSEDVEKIHERLKKVLDSMGLSMADTARRIGDPDSQAVRDICSGRKRATADFLARLVPLGVDVMYILTGQRSKPDESTLTPDEHALLDNYKHADEDGRAAARAVLSAVKKQKAA